MEKQYQYNSVEEALEELRQGRIVLVTDDRTGKMKGDMICAAEFATQENINFGMPCERADLHTDEVQRWPGNWAFHRWSPKIQITIRLHLRYPLTMWIRQQEFQQQERGYTMRSLTEEGTKPQDLRRPGACFSLVARHGGVLVRNGSYRGNG